MSFPFRRVSGVTDHYAENDEHALQITRRIMKRVNNEKALSSGLSSCSAHVKPKPPLYPADYLYGILNPQNKNSFDIKKVFEVLSRLLILCFGFMVMK